MSSRRVFISYTHSAKEKEWVRRFSDSLKDRGLSVWLDQVQIHPGDDLAGALEQGLRQSDTIVSILNQDSVNSPGTLFEMGAAFGMGKRVIPVVPEDLDLSRSFLTRFGLADSCSDARPRKRPRHSQRPLSRHRQSRRINSPNDSPTGLRGAQRVSGCLFARRGCAR